MSKITTKKKLFSNELPINERNLYANQRNASLKKYFKNGIYVDKKHYDEIKKG